MARNKTLLKANTAKQDEFYTTYDAIQEELTYYEGQFEGKTVLCNCDDPFESNFAKFFLRNFNYLKLERLICTSYAGSPMTGTHLSLFDDYNEPVTNKHGYVLDISKVPMSNGRGVSDMDISALLHSKDAVSCLKGNGDYSSEECLNYLEQADIVVTNPPFSLFREYINQLFEYKKKFLIIGRMTAVTYKEILPHFMNGDVWLGKNSGHFWFKVPSYYEPKKTDFKIDENGQKWRRMGNICWFTNLDYKARHEDLLLYKHYNPSDYPKYDNYDAIDVSAVKNIPLDYDGVMGVPTTFLAKWNPDQFELLGSSRYHDGSTEANDINFINGKGKFTRILIRRKNEN